MSLHPLVHAWLVEHKLARTLRRATRDFYHFQGFNQSAALAYYALLSFIPLIFLAVAEAGLILGNATEARHFIEDQLGRVAPWFLGDAKARLDQFIEAARGLSLISLIGILWGSGIFFAGLHRNLVVPWRHGGEQLSRWRTIFPWLAGPVLSLALLVVMAAVHAASYLPPGILPGTLNPGLWTLLSLAGAVFSLYYITLPRCCPLLSSALLSLVLAGMSQGLTWVFATLLTRLPNYSLIYGPLAGTVLFLLWLDYNMALILWGAHFVRIWSDDQPEGRTS